MKKYLSFALILCLCLALLMACDSGECTQHVYDHDCDAICNTPDCGYERAVLHSYDHNCDNECNTTGCGFTRSIEHVFAHACDVECNTIGCTYTRSIEHVYDNACDTECNTDGCGFVRSIEHSYDHACDPICNVLGCNYTRTVEHFYDNDCDTTCNTSGCDNVRTVSDHSDQNTDGRCDGCGITISNATQCTDHKYDNVCDTVCNTVGCGYTIAVNHVFDNACDSVCNTVGCGHTRITQHVYDNECDSVCNISGCGFTRIAPHIFDHECATSCKSQSCGFKRSASKAHTDRVPKYGLCEVCNEEFVLEDNQVYKKMQTVLLLGQSNMSGRGDLDTVEKIYDPRIYMMRNYEFVTMVEPIHLAARGGAGIGATFAKAFVETFDCELGLVPCAVGGTSLADWAVGGELYNEAIKCAKAALETSEICAILWHQGESDQNNTQYASQLHVIFDAMIEELGLDADKLVIVTGELFGTRSDAVHRPQLELLGNAYKNYGIASSDGLKVFDVTTHFDAPSIRVFGYRYFNIFYNCIVGKNYSYIDDIEHYIITPPDNEGVKELIVSKSFDSNATGNPVDSGCYFTPKSGSLLITELSATEKYLKATNGVNAETGYTDDTHFDVKGNVAADSVYIVKAKFKIDEGFDSGISLLKSIDSSNTTTQTVYVGRDGKLYAKRSGDNSYTVDLGYSLDVLEWTEIKVVIDLKNNQRKIYIEGNEVLSDTLSARETSGKAIAKVRVVQFDQKTGLGSICIDDYKCYIPEKNVFINYICDQEFNTTEEKVFTEQADLEGIHIRNLADSGKVVISEDGIVSVSAESGSVPYIDLMKTVNADTTFIIEGKFKLGENFNAGVDLLKPTPNDGSFRLVRLDSNGALYDWDYGTNALGVKLCQLSETDWTTVTIVCDLENNVKDIYINGKLVAEGLKVYGDGIENTRVTKVRAIQFFKGSGTVYIDYVRYWYAEN